MKARLPRPHLSDLSDRLALTIPECAQTLGLNEKTVRNRIYAGELPATRMGRSVVVLVEALRVYLRQQTVWPCWSACYIGPLP